MHILKYVYIYSMCIIVCKTASVCICICTSIFTHTVEYTHAHMYSYLYIQHICTIHLYKQTFEHTFTYTHKLTPSKSFTFPCPKKNARHHQYGDAMSASNLEANRGIAEEWVAPGFFLPQEGGTVSIEGRETVSNPFPVVPQARLSRNMRGLHAPVRATILTAVPDGAVLTRHTAMVRQRGGRLSR